jgi:hypothetical protein
MPQSYFVESYPVGDALIHADMWMDMTELPMTM